jgi:hypothetical protein
MGGGEKLSPETFFDILSVPQPILMQFFAFDVEIHSRSGIAKPEVQFGSVVKYGGEIGSACKPCISS